MTRMWLRMENLKEKAKTLLVAAQNNDILANFIRAEN